LLENWQITKSTDNQITNHKTKIPKATNLRDFVSWYLPESNWGHMDFQSIALPSELRYLPAWKSGAKIKRLCANEKGEFTIFKKLLPGQLDISFRTLDIWRWKFNVRHPVSNNPTVCFPII
jgi:hypothetical protein